MDGGTTCRGHGGRVYRFDGDMIVEARAYLDSAMVDCTIHRNENLGWQ